MKKTLSVVALLLVVSFALCACFFLPNTPQTPVDPANPEQPVDPKPSNPDVPPTQSRVQFTTPANGAALYDGVIVKVQDTVLPLYNVKVNNVHSWSPNPTTSRTDTGVGYFFLDGNVQVSVQSNGMTSCVVRPLSAGVTATVSNNVATFTISSAGEYSIEPNGDAQQAVFLFVSTFDEQTPVSTTANIIRFEKGVHNSANNGYINNNTVSIGSDTTVILEDGAVVQARFVANNASNVTICGTGIIDGSTFVRNATTNEVTVPLDFNYCKNITFKNFSVLDPAGWCVNWYFCEDSVIDNIKIITSRSNGDGISLQSCKRIDVSNCFVRAWDDNLVVKNYPAWSDKNIEGATEDITFTNCTLWTDLAQSMEVGYETVGSVMKNITFSNITVLHNFHKPVMSIHNGNNANITDVTFDTITVEDASMGKGDAGANNQLIEFAVEYNATWSNQHKTTALGSISNVTVSNVSVLDGNGVQYLRIAGCVDNRTGYNNSVHTVNNVTFNNVWLMSDKKLTSGYNNLSINNYTSNITVNVGGAMVIAPFAFSLTAEQLATYTSTATVTVL